MTKAEMMDYIEDYILVGSRSWEDVYLTAIIQPIIKITQHHDMACDNMLLSKRRDYSYDKSRI